MEGTRGKGVIMTNEWLEKELEDYIVAHPRSVTSEVFKWHSEEITVKTLGRQVHCGAGIIDVLIWAYDENASRLLVVECKAKKEKGLAVEQAQRYVTAIRDSDIYSRTPSDAWPNFETGDHGWAQYIELNIIPVLIAPSFSQHLLTTYDGVLITASKNGNKFELERTNGYARYNDEPSLTDAIRPVIERAHNDAKAKHITRRLQDSLPIPFTGSFN